MAIALVLDDAQVLQALRSFLLAVLPSKIMVIRGQQNRVAEPNVDDFVVMTPMMRQRLSTNIVTYADAAFTGSASGTTLTITKMLLGSVVTGATLFGASLSGAVTILGPLSASGGIGTYTLSSAQTSPLGVLACGSALSLQPTQVTVQLDVHGSSANDNAQIISTLLRDDFGVQQFVSSGFAVTPLHADDPRQMPFVNAEQQYEYRWVVTAVLQANQAVMFPQQFASQLNIGFVPVA